MSMTERTYLILRKVAGLRESSMAALVEKLVDDIGAVEGVQVTVSDVEQAILARKDRKKRRADQREELLREHAHRLRSGGL